MASTIIVFERFSSNEVHIYFQVFQNSANIAEDDVTKKEREILEILEQEEKWKYNNTTNPEDNLIG